MMRTFIDLPLAGGVTGARFRIARLATSPGDKADHGEEGR